MFSSAIQRLHDRRNGAGDVGEDAGFTLIELMVVLLILAILLAIAIPTFLGVTKSANDRAAQSNLNTALLNAKAQYQQNSQSYPTTANLVTALQSAEPSLQFVNGSTTASTDQNHISVFASTDGNALVLAAYSAQTHNCWIVVDTPAVTGATAPFGTPAAPAQGTVAATTSVVFLDTQVGPTYAEIKGNSVLPATLQAGCQAGQPSATAATTWGTSTTQFPAL
ncbi:MAG: type II secretion system protein [Acidimicrobiales bacterium]